MNEAIVNKPPEKKSGTDAAYELGRAVVSAVPMAGGPLQVLFENIFTAPLERRKAEWLRDLAEVIEEIDRRVEGLEAADLGRNEAFVTTAMQASQIALRNHQREKLEALRNAVLNAGLPNAPSDDEQAIFVRLIDQLTPWHLRLLAFLNDPIAWMTTSGSGNPGWPAGAVATVIEHCFPDLRGKRDLYDQLVQDLQVAGLVAQGPYMHGMMTSQGMVASRTTSIGRRFLAFITDKMDGY